MKNTLVGFLMRDLLPGMSYAWWGHKLNRHHANPTRVDLDESSFTRMRDGSWRAG